MPGQRLLTSPFRVDWLTNPADGTKAKNGTWSFTGIANGFARYWRLKDSTGTTCVLQGLCSQNWAASSPWSLNQHCNNGGNVYKCHDRRNVGRRGRSDRDRHRYRRRHSRLGLRRRGRYDPRQYQRHEWSGSHRQHFHRHNGERLIYEHADVARGHHGGDG
jgi:hypothetical protein